MKSNKGGGVGRGVKREGGLFERGFSGEFMVSRNRLEMDTCSV